MSVTLTPMGLRKLANLLDKKGHQAGWHVYINHVYVGFSTLSLSELVAETLEKPGHKFLDATGNIASFVIVEE